jgi:Predicted hydrolase of the alpha/beta superfamily
MKMPRRINWRAVFLLAVAGAVIWTWMWLNPRHPERVDILSKALGEKRFLLVHLPSGYGPGVDSFPLLVLLDGGDQKQFSGDKTLYSRAKEILARLEAEGLPPLILVGIGNRDRERDMTPVRRPDIYAGGGGARAFMEFIETEIVPFVENRWRIGSKRILYGESYGGLFVLDALARGRQVFTDYIAVSPAVGVWPDGLNAAFHHRFSAPSPVRSLYIVYGEKDAPLVGGYTIPFFREIDGILPGEMRRRLDILPKEGHNPENSLERGLLFIFSEKQEP